MRTDSPPRTRLLRHALPFLLFVACTPSGGGRAEGAPPAVSQQSAVPVPASTVRAIRRKVPVYREVAATVRSLDHIQVSAEIRGRVLRVHADVGDQVKKGQILAELDPETLRAAREEAAAGVELAAAEAERVRRLRDEKVAPEREWDRAQTNLRQARARLQLAEIDLAKARVQAPVDGIVEARLVGPGDLAVPGKPLYSIYDPSRVCLQTRLPVGDREHAELGARLQWVLDSVEGSGPVSEVAPSADPRSRTLRIRVPLAPDLLIRGERPAPGDFGTLRYQIGEREEVSVPRAAVFHVGQVETVLVEEGGRWVRRAVRTGTVHGDQVEILAGLKGGEEIGLP